MNPGPPKQRRAADRGTLAGRLRQAASGGGGWGPFISVTVALVMLAGWLFWYVLSHRAVTSDGEPAWAPDASRIVYDSDVRGRRVLMMMNADGTGAAPVQSGGAVDQTSGAFSPDGGRIAFDADAGGNRDIYVVSPATGHEDRLTTDPADDRSPAWLPDGRLVFASNRDARPAFDLYLMNADGSGVVRLTTTGDNHGPQVSPDGRSVAFTSGRDVSVLDLTTRDVRRLTDQTTAGDGMCPTWSPDGKRIAFMSARHGRMQIFVMNADGSNQQMQVTLPSGSTIGPRWSPKDDRILFVGVPEDAPRVDERGAAHERAIFVADGTGKVTRLSR